MRADGPTAGFSFGLLGSAFLFGFRHGIDWDHIAAITDITSSQETRREAMLFGTLYALGHALVVLALGVIAIIAGDRLPASIDEAMSRVVGVTLLLLGVYVFVSLVAARTRLPAAQPLDAAVRRGPSGAR